MSQGWVRVSDLCVRCSGAPGFESLYGDLAQQGNALGCDTLRNIYP